MPPDRPGGDPAGLRRPSPDDAPAAKDRITPGGPAHPAPLVLAFDTAGPACAAALVRGDVVLAEAEEAMPTGQAERLMLMLEALLRRAGVVWRDLDRIGVGTGPGNFTGVRIAVAAARGLSMGLGIPAVGVTRFEAVAHGLPRPVAVVEDARRGEVYVQCLDAGDPSEPVLRDLSDMPVVLGGMDVAGSAARAVASLTGGRVLPPAMPLAVAIARVAGLAPLPRPRPAPLYLRPPDAAPPRVAVPPLRP